MRIGLLTFHFATNHGGVLQCLALQKALQGLGADVSVLDYHPSPRVRLTRQVSGIVGRRVCQKLLNLLSTRLWDAPTVAAFDNFRRQHLRLTKPVNTIAGLVREASRYDALVVGSDQVWNGHWLWPVYFLDFLPQFTGRTVSYAASFGQKDQPQELHEKAPGWLRRFDSISVRDEMSRELVGALAGRDAEVVADPTLLVDLSEYALPCPVQVQNYIVVYFLNRANTERASRITKHVKQTLDLPVVSLVGPDHRGWRFPEADYVLAGIGPAQWLDVMGRAFFVCTDSFHGCLFAAKHQKPVVVFDDGGPHSERLCDAAKRYGLTERIVREPSEGMSKEWLLSGVNERCVQMRMAAHVDKSMLFLQTALASLQKGGCRA